MAYETKNYYLVIVTAVAGSYVGAGCAVAETASA